uniref:Uncharacterized protein n=1 Tax=viral metagenome TaxID=1070528 RepID=A0A6H1ZPK3_9ZZZZ
MFGLGAPVGGEADADASLIVYGGFRVAARDQSHGGDGDAARKQKAAADDGLSRAGVHRGKLGLSGMQGKRSLAARRRGTRPGSSRRPPRGKR